MPTVIDDVENGNVDGYTNTTDLSATTAAAYEGTYGIEFSMGNGVPWTTTSDDGTDLSPIPQPGEIIEARMQVESVESQSATAFIVGDDADNYYAAGIGPSFSITIWKYSNGAEEKIVEGSETMSLGMYYRVELDWHNTSSGTLTVTLYDDTNTEVDSVSLDDTEHGQGIVGWAYRHEASKGTATYYTDLLQRTAESGGGGETLELSASGSASGAGTASLTRERPLSVAGESSADGSASLSRERGLSAVGSGTATGTADLTRDRRLDAGGGAAGMGVAVLHRGQSLTASGTASAVGSAALSLGAVLKLAASGSMLAEGSANLARDRHLTANGASGAEGSAALARTRRLAAPGTATGAGQAALRRVRPLSAQGTTTTAHTASLARDRSLTATGAATASGSADLLVVVPDAGERAASTTGENSVVVISRQSLAVLLDPNNDVDIV